MTPPTFGSLFAGIGGIDLGLERAGFRCCWQVERDEYANRVLAKHWPDVPRYRDVRFFLGGKRWRSVRSAWSVDLIAGGFPCQDISVAGKGAGIDGSRSGLWSEYARIIRLLRPRFVLVENVAALLARGIDRVLGDLAACGYDAEWDCIPAIAVGAPHVRDRVFIVAHAQSDGCGPWWPGRTVSAGTREEDAAGMADAEHTGRLAPRPGEDQARAAGAFVGSGPARPDGSGHQTQRGDVPDADNWRFRCEERYATLARRDGTDDGLPQRNDHWGTEPAVGRVADGVPARVDRLRGLGNAVVPQVAEWIGRRIMNALSQ
jgi:DNA (cytosine-5)-methyltransferase 1